MSHSTLQLCNIEEVFIKKITMNGFNWAYIMKTLKYFDKKVVGIPNKLYIAIFYNNNLCSSLVSHLGHQTTKGKVYYIALLFHID